MAPMLRTATRALVFVLLLATPALAIDIVTCDQTVASGDVGVLQSDLSCGAVVGVNSEIASEAGIGRRRTH